MAEIWTLSQISDPNFIHVLKEHIEDINGLVILELADGKIKVSKRQAFLNLNWWPILVKFGIPICKRHFMKRKSLNKGTLIDFLDNYYEEIMSANPGNAEKLKQELWAMQNAMYALCFDYLPAYAGSIDIEDMAVIMDEPPMRKEIDSKWNIKEYMSTTEVENYIEHHRKVIMNMLGTPGALTRETLLPYQSIGMLNKFQVPQTMYAFGVRTDVNDNIIRKPVIGSAIDGLRDIHEFAIEALSAKKSMFYNKNNVSASQYFGRKQHLLASTVKYLYYGDCGSTQLVPFYVCADDPEHGIVSNANNVIGKNIVEDGKLVTITRSNVGNYMNRTIYMRSPMTCRYKDGVCDVCGGRILSNLSRSINIGIMSAIHTIEPVTQKILSAKHLIKTKSITYQMPPEVKNILEQVNTNEIRWNPKIYPKLKDLKLGIPVDYFKGFHDVLLLRTDNNKTINEGKISHVDAFLLKLGDKVSSYNLYQDKLTPHLSSEFLIKIRDIYEQVEIRDNVIWIPVADTDRIPIFKTIVVNDNMLEYVKSVQAYLGDPITKSTTCAQALKEFSDIIYSKVEVNIVHIEVLLKAYEVTSDTDPRIPLVEDANKVQFGTTTSILRDRHVGVRLGYEKVNAYLCSPSTYITPRQKSPFDLMVGYKTT